MLQLSIYKVSRCLKMANAWKAGACAEQLGCLMIIPVPKKSAIWMTTTQIIWSGEISHGTSKPAYLGIIHFSLPNRQPTWLKTTSDLCTLTKVMFMQECLISLSARSLPPNCELLPCTGSQWLTRVYQDVWPQLQHTHPGHLCHTGQCTQFNPIRPVHQT